MRFSRSNLAHLIGYPAETCSCLLILLSLYLPSGASAARLPKTTKCRSAVEVATRDLGAGRIYEALANLKQVIHRQPDCGNAYFYLGTIYLGIHQDKTSTSYARKAIELDPRKGAYHNLMGAILLEGRNSKGALKELYQALADKRIKQPEKVWTNIGYAREQLLEWDDAARAFNAALKIRRDDVQVQVALAKVYLQSNRPDDAIRQLLSATRLAPDQAEIYALLGVAYGRNRQTVQQVEAETKAASLNPTDKTAHYSLAQSLMKLGQKEQGLQELEQFRNLEKQELEAQQRASRLDTTFLTATAKISQGDFVQAAELLQQIVDADSDFLPAFYSLGFVFLKQAKYEAAITTLEKAVALDRVNAGAYFYLGNAYKNTGKLSQALEATQRAVVIYDENANYFNQLGEIYLELGREADAEDAFEQAVTLDGKFALAQLNLGSLALQLGEVEKAITHLKAAVEIGGSSAEPHRLLGLAYFNDGQFDQCIEQYREAVRLKPDDEQLRMILGEALVRLRRWQDAEMILKDSIQANPHSARAHYNLAELYRIQGRFGDALGEFQKASEAKPDIDLDRMYAKIGTVYANELDFGNAARSFLRALEINPNLVVARLDLANLYARQSRYDEALKEYATILSLEPSRPDVYANLAQVYLKTSNYDRAIESGRKALDLDPRQRQAEYTVAQALIRLGRVQQGHEELSKFQRMEAEAEAEEHHVREALSLNQEALSAVAKNQYDKAIMLLRRAVDHDPQMGLPYASLGFVLMKTSDHEQAVKNLRKALELNFDLPQIHRYLAEEYKAMGRLAEGAKEHSIYIKMQEERMRVLNEQR